MEVAHSIKFSQEMGSFPNPAVPKSVFNYVAINKNNYACCSRITFNLCCKWNKFHPSKVQQSKNPNVHKEISVGLPV